MAALLMDLADVSGNVNDGCHIASMGGPWMKLTYGLGGMRDDDGILSFWPRRAPEGQRGTSVSRDLPQPDVGRRNRLGESRVHSERGQLPRDPP
jgi:hypothetical protein